MPIDYDLADEGKFRDTFYDRHHDSDHNYHRQRGSEEPNMKFAAREAEEMLFLLLLLCMEEGGMIRLLPNAIRRVAVHRIQ